MLPAVSMFIVASHSTYIQFSTPAHTHTPQAPSCVSFRTQPCCLHKSFQTVLKYIYTYATFFSQVLSGYTLPTKVSVMYITTAEICKKIKSF